MPAVPRACPRCKGPLDVPQPPPPKVTCPKCRAVIKISASAKTVGAGGGSPAPEPSPFELPAEPAGLIRTTATSSAAPRRRRLGDMLFLAAFLAVLIGGGVAAVSLFRDKGPPAEPIKEKEKEREKQQVAVIEPPKDLGPDPRIKIVQPSVDKGVAYLKARVNAKEPFPMTDERIGAQWEAGVAGLIGLTLLDGGVPALDPAVQRVAHMLRADAPKMTKIYVLSAALFFLNRWHETRPLDEADRKLAQTFALRIIAGQKANGVWGYDGVLLPPEEEAALLARLKTGDHKPTGQGEHWTISNTQFAMLALWGARKHGIPVRDALLAAAAHFNTTQYPDGHWIYSDREPDPHWATSTCAGLMALALEKALREDKEFAAERRVAADGKKRAEPELALAYVGKSIGRRPGDPGGANHQYVGKLFQADAWGDLYFLWSVERVGVIYRQALIGGKDWFEWGYPIVMKAQNSDGSWEDRHGPLVDTCFALLFLTRANIAKDLTEKLRELARLQQAALDALPGAPKRKEL